MFIVKFYQNFFFFKNNQGMAEKKDVHKGFRVSGKADEIEQYIPDKVIGHAECPLPGIFSRSTNIYEKTPQQFFHFSYFLHGECSLFISPMSIS